MKKYEGIVNCTNEEYHAEKKHFSSSNLKMLLDDPADFYKYKIEGKTKEYSTNTLNAFAEGTYAHSLILEPHMIDKEFRFFNGFRKQGKDWEAFKNDPANEGFVLMSKSQKKKVENWVKSYEARKKDIDLIKGGEPELTLFGDLMGLPIKVRADYLNADVGYLADVKTTASPSDVDSFKYTVDSFKYELSAALYLMMFEKHFGKKLDFYFVVLGKRDSSCEIFKLSEEKRAEGEAKIMQAIEIYKKCKKTGIWSLPGASSNDNIDLDSEYEILEI